jgi:hypothetical protein
LADGNEAGLETFVASVEKNFGLVMLAERFEAVLPGGLDQRPS